MILHCMALLHILFLHGSNSMQEGYCTLLRVTFCNVGHQYVPCILPNRTSSPHLQV